VLLCEEVGRRARGAGDRGAAVAAPLIAELGGEFAARWPLAVTRRSVR
jgi:hypothetical protein